MINKLAEISNTKKNALSVILIATVAFIIYSNTFYSSFHFDDTPAIVENYAIHRFDLKEIFSTSSRPILDLTFALNYYFGKLDVFGYHLVNIMLHVANGIMLYFILLWTINTPHPNPPPQGGRAGEGVLSANNFRIPLYAGLIFIAHPVQTQAVTYIVSRSSVLATTFYLLTLLLFIKAFRQRAKSEEQRAGSEELLANSKEQRAKGEEQRAKSKEQRANSENSMPYALSSKLYLTGAFLASCLGMGTKQEAATLPLMLLIYDFFFVSKGDRKTLKGHYKVHLAILSTLAIALYLNFSGLQAYISFDYAKGIPMPQEAPITSFQYFLTQLHVIPYYIRLLFIPAGMNLDYDWPITRNIDLPTILFFILLTFIVITAIKLYNKARLISFGIIWFFVTLSVTSSFIVIYDVIFEHRLYLPSIGFAIVMAFIISRISELKIAESKRL